MACRKWLGLLSGKQAQGFGMPFQNQRVLQAELIWDFSQSQVPRVKLLGVERELLSVQM
jgi:hypothetical protein